MSSHPIPSTLSFHYAVSEYLVILALHLSLLLYMSTVFALIALRNNSPPILKEKANYRQTRFRILMLLPKRFSSQFSLMLDDDLATRRKNKSFLL